MRNALTGILRILALVCILAGIVLWCTGCATDDQGNTRMFGFVTDTNGKSHFSADQASKDSHNPQMQAQAGALGPWGAPGLEALGGLFFLFSHLNKRLTAGTQRHAVATLAGGPARLPGVLVSANPTGPATPAIK